MAAAGRLAEERLVSVEREVGGEDVGGHAKRVLARQRRRLGCPMSQQDGECDPAHQRQHQRAQRTNFEPSFYSLCHNVITISAAIGCGFFADFISL